MPVGKRVTRLASAHQQHIVDLSRKPKMIKHLPHRAAEFGIEPLQQRRLGWDNEIIVGFSGRGEQRRQLWVVKTRLGKLLLLRGCARHLATKLNPAVSELGDSLDCLFDTKGSVRRNRRLGLRQFLAPCD